MYGYHFKIKFLHKHANFCLCYCTICYFLNIKTLFVLDENIFKIPKRHVECKIKVKFFLTLNQMFNHFIFLMV